MLSKADLTLITTDHSSIDYQLVADHSNAILDTRNALVNIKKIKRIIICYKCRR